jgi:host factor-I protein
MESPTRKAVRPPIAAEMTKSSKPPAQAPAKKQVPPDQTYAENFYYLKQMQGKTPMVIVLQDGEKLNGVIEWYDRTCLKVNREDGPNLMLFKSNIKYMYKAE